jgi:hypothetical protein
MGIDQFHAANATGSDAALFSLLKKIPAAA